MHDLKERLKEFLRIKNYSPHTISNYERDINRFLSFLEEKKINPDDLMPNIQYWLGEVYYANKNFQQAVIEFGEGFAKYPDSIKDEMKFFFN